ncbi:uncharacterized protein LOC118190956 [Stegodyphus dumicola]|uniref:uncharacterized protein LOC118190956 n=1 Tax=Stegodyphus dumicola TaxID=202533 RepID=UPI0015AA00EC|nr:uncharacterized protein LOC118190956 [Stegodyphus dumicola]
MEEREKKNKTVAEVAEEKLKSSLLTGVPNIFLEKTIAWKIIRITGILLFMFLFAYQLHQFLTEYLKYPTVSTTKFLTPMDTNEKISFALPGIVICNKNPVLRSNYCSAYPTYCYRPENERAFCQKYEHYCEHSELPKDFMIARREIFSEFVVKEFHQTEGDFWIERDLSAFGPVENEGELYAVFYEMGYLPCYERNYVRGDPIYPVINDINYDVKNLRIFSSIRLDFDLKNTAHMEIESGGLLGIGSPFEPFFPDIAIKPGWHYDIRLQMIEERRLPYPYDTDCQDYHEEWRKNNFSGPLSRKICIMSCVIKKFLESGEESCCPMRKYYVEAALPIKFLCLDYRMNFCGIYMYDYERECSGICKESCLIFRYSYSIEKSKVTYSLLHER